MELTKKILLADTGEEFRRSFIENLDSEPDIQVVGETGDGEELLRMVRDKQPDVVIMEIVLAVKKKKRRKKRKRTQKKHMK